MGIISRIAWRYFKSKKSVQAINLISWISMGAIAIAAAAMIILFSVFNGLDSTIKDMYTSFNPEIKVTAQKGKFFSINKEKEEQLRNLPGVKTLSKSIEDMALLNNENEQRVAVVKGIDNDWFRVAQIDSYLIIGAPDWATYSKNHTPAILGLSIANNLSLNVNNPYAELLIYYPRSGITAGVLNPDKALAQTIVKPEGLFHVQQDIDNKYILIPFEAAQHLFEQEGQVSSLEFKTDAPYRIKKVKQAVAKIMGNDFVVADRFEQNATLFMVLSSEKWMVYAILLFVLLIASFNLTGSLYMLVLEKKRDITILKSMGMSHGKVRKIFLLEGVLITMVGAVSGVVIGTLICLGQIYFGWISLPDGFVVSAYPVKLLASDFLLILGTAFIIGLFAGWYPSFRAGKQGIILRQE